MRVEPIVFLPGMMCDARAFAPQVAALSRRHPVVIAPIDLGDTIGEIASNLLLSMPEKFALVGHSMGGIVAMELVRRAPERVTRLALLSTNALAETPSSAGAYEPWIVAAKAGRLEDALREMMRQDYFAPGEGRLAILNAFIEMARAQGEEAFVRQCRALQRRRDMQSTLRRCKVPTMVLCGEFDGLTPVKRHKSMADLIPSAELKVVSGAGHFPMLEQPAVTTEAITGWLEQPYLLRA